MSTLKKLASQTAIYGLSSILGRLLNFALTPLHTKVLNQEEYGVNVDIYSIIAFLMVIITFGMETAFFRFFSDKDQPQKHVFGTAVSVVGVLSLLVILLTLIFQMPLAELMRYESRPHFVLWMMLIVSADAISAVPFAKLRAENRPVRFVIVRMSVTLCIVLLNLLFFLGFPTLAERGFAPALMEKIYRPELGVAYIFIANLIGNGLMLLLFLPDFLKIKKPSKALMRRMLMYAAPLVVAGLAGIANEMANRQFLKYLLPENESLEAVGIFGANIKIATFMMLFIQAFRFAAEPFFFSGEGNFNQKMAKVMRYFVIIQTVIFLGLVCFLDIIKWTHFIDEKFWSGLSIVPILIFANVLLGINFNLNIWYKLKNKTRMGAYITFWGLGFTIVSNIILIPKYGIMGAAWGTLISYAAMTGYSYYLNQKHDKTDYPVGRILTYLGVSAGLAALAFYGFDYHLIPSTLIFLCFLVFVWIMDGKEAVKLLKSSS